MKKIYLPELLEIPFQKERSGRKVVPPKSIQDLPVGDCDVIQKNYDVLNQLNAQPETILEMLANILSAPRKKGSDILSAGKVLQALTRLKPIENGSKKKNFIEVEDADYDFLMKIFFPEDDSDNKEKEYEGYSLPVTAMPLLKSLKEAEDVEVK